MISRSAAASRGGMHTVGGSAPALSDADLRQWSDLLGEVAGWTFGRLRAPSLERALAARMAALECQSCQEYYERVFAKKDSDATELAHLVELLSNTETSFFRNEPLHKAVSDHVIPAILERARSGRQANIWSAGCSTGQEPYSLALSLAEQAVQAGGAEGCSVWGSDINRSALAVARRGRYSQDDIESLPRRFRSYLQAEVEGRQICYEISEAIRARTTFVWTNLHAPREQPLSYDLIVCQNVLLYFNARSGLRLVQHLCARLAPGGFLFLGPGEAAEAAPTGVEVVPFPQARAFRRPE